MDTEYGHVSFKKRVMRFTWVLWRLVSHLLETIADGLIDAWRVMRHEAGLFWGAGFSIIAICGFSSGRYCDGNTAEYLSCTRPATYYYYDMLHIALLVLGIFFILVWFLKSRHRH